MANFCSPQYTTSHKSYCDLTCVSEIQSCKLPHQKRSLSIVQMPFQTDCIYEQCQTEVLSRWRLPVAQQAQDSTQAVCWQRELPCHAPTRSKAVPNLLVWAVLSTKHGTSLWWDCCLYCQQNILIPPGQSYAQQSHLRPIKPPVPS